MVTRTTFLSALVLLFSIHSGYAAPEIEGGTEETLKKNAETLKSVLLLELNGGLCTSTLVAKNVVITARHCTEHLNKGQITNLGGNLVHVIDILQQPEMEIKESGKIVQNTDVALVLFKPLVDQCEKSPFKNIKPILLAQPNDGVQYQQELLLSGYGKNSPDTRTAGELRAGVNRLATQNEVDSLASEIGEKDLNTGDYIVTLSTRLESASGVAKPGDIFEIARVMGEAEVMINRDTSANTLPGDSGGSLIAYDAANNPYIIGITSKGGGIYKKMDYSVMVPGRSESVLSGSASVLEVQKAGGLAPIIAAAFLKQSEYPLVYPVEVPVLTADRSRVEMIKIPHNMQDFTLTLSYNRTAVSLFNSVTTEANVSFIKNSLATFEAERVALGNSICQ